jgi:hypothetical protein
MAAEDTQSALKFRRRVEVHTDARGSVSTCHQCWLPALTAGSD